MFIVIQHQISNPEKFWGTAQEATSKLPAGLKLHSSFPNADGSKQCAFGKLMNLIL